MRNLTLSQWNFLWSKGNGGCKWQGMDESEVRSHLGCDKFFEVVQINAEGYKPMFGVVTKSTVNALLEGRTGIFCSPKLA